MKVAKYRSYALVILTRDEHCPPHVHVGNAEWEARFKFSFWHDSVCLWDVVPVRATPKAALLEHLRQTLMKPANLQAARRAWWRSRKTVCLDNLFWQPASEVVVSPKGALAGARRIVSAAYDQAQDRTVLELEGIGQVEIEL